MKLKQKKQKKKNLINGDLVSSDNDDERDDESDHKSNNVSDNKSDNE